MERHAEPQETPHAPMILALLEAMLDDGPIDPAILTQLRDPAAGAAMAKADAELRALDWPNLGRYQASNAEIIASGERPDIVFMGDSITEAWPLGDPAMFGPGRVGRGIGGQTSPQMLIRFTPDVLALKPKTVHLASGGNDIAGNTGPSTPARVQDNLTAMLDLAQAHGLRVLLSSITPASVVPWNPTMGDPRPWIAEMNAWLEAEAGRRGATFMNYHPALADETGAMRAEFTRDGVHPNRKGYAAMREVFERALA